MVYVTTGITQDIQCFRIIAKVNANFCQDGLGIIFNDLGSLIAEDINRCNLADNKRFCQASITACAGTAAGITATTATTFSGW